MKKALSLFLAIVLCVTALTACGGGSSVSNDPNMGLWTAYSYDMLGIESDITSLYAKGSTIELKSNGSCTADFGGERSTGKWTLSGSSLTITIGGVEYPGSIVGGLLTFELYGIPIYYSKDGKPVNSTSTMSANNLLTPPPPGGESSPATGSTTPAPPESSPPGSSTPETPPPGSSPSGTSPTPPSPTPSGGTSPTPPSPTPSGSDPTNMPPSTDGPNSGSLADTIAWWSGDWYGSLFVSDTSTAYSNEYLLFIDLYCVIRTNQNGTAVVYLWGDEYEYGTVEIQIEAISGSRMGVATATGGKLFNYPVNRADWIIYPDASEYSNMIVIRELFVDTDGDWLDYEILLRPWGMNWDDVDPYDYPPGYEDWYQYVNTFAMIDVLTGYSIPMHPGLS